MRLGLFFFGRTPVISQVDAYGQLLNWAREADASGFEFISVPERHFDTFGGPYPNPALLCAFMASVTTRIQLRAGSVVLPLHDELTVAEDWSVVDNLSDGRIALCIGSGWNVNDFVLAPAAYEHRRTNLASQIQTLQHLWSAGRSTRINGTGTEVEVSLHPRPVQARVPIWITSSRSADTVRDAGARGFNLLTHLENQDFAGLARQISIYRAAREDAGLDPSAGIVTLMQHTLASDNPLDLKQAELQLRAYLEAALDLEAGAVRAGGGMSGQKLVDEQAISDSTRRESIVAHAVARYAGESGLIGSRKTVQRRLARLEATGVNEVACLVDFVSDPGLLSRGITTLAGLVRESVSQDDATAFAVQAFNGVGAPSA